MANVNKVMLTGNLTRDVQLSYLPSQTAVAEFGLAINHRFKKQDGTEVKDVCFVDCQMFGKRAEVLNRYMKKGDPLFVEGRLRYESWEKDGVKRSKLRVFVENFEFLGRGGGGGGEGGGGEGSESDVPGEPEHTSGAAADDGIPF